MHTARKCKTEPWAPCNSENEMKQRSIKYVDSYSIIIIYKWSKFQSCWFFFPRGGSFNSCNVNALMSYVSVQKYRTPYHKYCMNFTESNSETWSDVPIIFYLIWLN